LNLNFSNTTLSGKQTVEESKVVAEEEMQEEIFFINTIHIFLHNKNGKIKTPYKAIPSGV